MTTLADRETLTGYRPQSTRRAPQRSAQTVQRALFGRADHGIDLPSRHLVAAFVAELTDPGSPIADHYRTLADNRLLPGLLDAAARFSFEHDAHRDDPRDRWRVSADARTELGVPLTAVLEQAHLLVTRPADARAKVLARLSAAGWARPQIVVWSQLIAFVGHQVRAAAGFSIWAQNL